MHKTIGHTNELGDKLLGNTKIEHVLFGTEKGDIGVIMNLPQNIYNILLEL